MGNTIIIKQTSCTHCPAGMYDYYYPTSDSFDMDHVGYCRKTLRKDNEVGYGRKDEDFPIPDWCPILLEQKEAEKKW